MDMSLISLIHNEMRWIGFEKSKVNLNGRVGQMLAQGGTDFISILSLTHKI